MRKQWTNSNNPAFKIFSQRWYIYVNNSYGNRKRPLYVNYLSGKTYGMKASSAASGSVSGQQGRVARAGGSATAASEALELQVHMLQKLAEPFMFPRTAPSVPSSVRLQHPGSGMDGLYESVTTAPQLAEFTSSDSTPEKVQKYVILQVLDSPMTDPQIYYIFR
jgi:hypothetical protein